MPNVTGDTLVWAVVARGAFAAAAAGPLARARGTADGLNPIVAAR
jgi:hypothetical protein